MGFVAMHSRLLQGLRFPVCYNFPGAGTCERDILAINAFPSAGHNNRPCAHCPSYTQPLERAHSRGLTSSITALRAIVLGYSAILLIGVWSYALHVIQSDFRLTEATTRERLRARGAAFNAEVEAMMGDGVGAAVAAANEIGGQRGFRGRIAGSKYSKPWAIC